MIPIPTVKSFLGCVDLKVACLTIAAFRLVVSIISLVVILFAFVIMEDEAVEASKLVKDDKASFGLIEFFIAVYAVIAGVVIVINIITTYWFIQGVTSNKPVKMKYYLWVEIAIVVLLLLSFRLIALIAAPMECYVFICSNSLYQESLMNQYNEHADNASENTVIKVDNAPPPPVVYSGPDQNMQPTQPQNTNSNPFKE